jgi:hypothetical protein
MRFPTVWELELVSIMCSCLIRRLSRHRENAGAASAKQTLTLSPGRDVQAFNAQVAGLRTVVALIERVLVAQAADTRTPQTSNGLTRELRLQRRVFTRVRSLN